jgi:hypothetical protein
MTDSALWQRIRSEGLTTIAVMGMTKNTGKTVALNHLLACAADAGVDVGVTSIGRDGEERDQVFSFPKPPVMVWPGTLVATARDTLLRAKLRWEPVRQTGIDSPMGEIVIVRALDHGEMEIAGASRSSDLQKVISQLKQGGCELVILDGALGRSHHASPAIADGVILATGAAIGGAIPDVIRKTRDRLAILGIGQAAPELVTRCRDIFTGGGVGIWDRDGELLLRADIATLTAASTLLGFVDHALATIAVSGAVGRSLWQAVQTLAMRHPKLAVVVADGTRLFIEHTDVADFRKQGGTLVAYRGIRLAGVTLNPFSPMGGHFVAEEFLDAARLSFPDYDVTDVMLAKTTKSTGVI